MGTNVSPRYVSCSLVRYCSNRQFYWSAFAVLALTALFAVLDVQTISSTVSIAADGAIRSTDSLDPDPAHIVSDAVLASPYQTSIILIPIIVALNVAAGFRAGDERQLRLLVNRPWPLAIGDVLATVIYCAGVSLLSSLLNAAILVATLNPVLRPMCLTMTVVTTPLRVMVFAVVMGLVGYITAVATKRDVPALAMILLLLIVSLSGVLKAIHLDVLLPMIGGKSFAFGRIADAGDIPMAASSIVMACWLTVTFCAAVIIRGQFLQRSQA
ncbi:hypothetical protein [Bifidobacterium miconisargentati]|uniref:hypothetical protein n=1 Tax=Bifidobacterium miconisargentati TaxID=2834437 RepID=UPI001BDC2306|nr:hypothetical protein [Bifidobacterium miconisargentati]MBW3090205.1 hypothetical protein [Bifidobacterium miconisargentati]